MSTKHKILIALILSSVNVFGQSTEIQIVDQLHRKKFDWLIQKQYDSLNLLLDTEVRYIHSNGWTQDKPEVLSDLKTGKLLYKQVTIQQAETLFYETSAVVVGKGKFEGTMAGTSFSVDLLYTETYVRLNGHWRLVSRHACKL